MLQHLIIQFLLYCLSNGRLREVKNDKKKFQTLSSRGGRDRVSSLHIDLELRFCRKRQFEY